MAKDLKNKSKNDPEIPNSPELNETSENQAKDEQELGSGDDQSLPKEEDPGTSEDELSNEKVNENSPEEKDSSFDENGKPSDGLKLTMDSEMRLRAEAKAKADYDSNRDENSDNWDLIDGRLRESLIDKALEKLK